MVTLTLPSTITARMSIDCDSKPESLYVWQDDVAATTIQSVMRMFLAKKECDNKFVKHIEREVLRLKIEARERAKRARKRTFLDKKATAIQSLLRGYIVRNEYKKIDWRRRNNEEDVNDDRGNSLMYSVRKRMDVRKRIEDLRRQISNVRSKQSSLNTDSENDNDNDNDNNHDHDHDHDHDNENNDEVSISKVERLKTRQNKLQTKAETLEAVTRPLREKFESMRAENERLRKKYRKLEAKNETRQFAQETFAELLEEKMETIEELNKELNTTLSSERMQKLTQELSKAMKKVDALAATANTYAKVGMNEQDAAAFADAVARIGWDAHQKAKLFGDSLRSHMATNLSKYGSNRSLTSVSEDRSATETATISTASESYVGLSPSRPRRGHGRVLTRLLRDRSRSRDRSSEEVTDVDSSVTPTLQRRDESFTNTPRISNSTRILLRRDESLNTTPRVSNSTQNLLRRDETLNTTPRISNSSLTLLRREGSFNNMPPKVITTTNSKPMRRRHSEIRIPNPQLQRRDLGLRKVLSERKILTTPSHSPPSSRLNVLRKELREEVRSNLRKELLQRDESRQPRRKSRDRSTADSLAVTKKSSKGSKKKEKSPRITTTKKPKQGSRNRKRSESPNRMADRLSSETNGVLGRKKNSKEHQLNLTTNKQQPRRMVSLTASTIDIRKSKRTYLRKVASLTENAKGRRRLVDE